LLLLFFLLGVVEEDAIVPIAVECEIILLSLIEGVENDVSFVVLLVFVLLGLP
jgi:hypothetical protein